MADFGDSFIREIGKNTGKAVSNIIFGDLHATPYRRVDTIREKESNAKIEKIQQDQLFAIDKAVLKNIDAVASIRIATDKNILLAQLSELSTQLKANTWYNILNEEGRIRNKFSDALFEKYTHAVRTLEKISPNDTEFEYFNKLHKRISWKKTLLKFGIIIGLAALFGIIGLVSWIDSLNNKEQDILLYSTIVIVLFAILTFVFIKIIRKKKIDSTDSHNEFNNQNQQSDIKSDKIDSSNFIDLNENNRIEIELTKIWQRYTNSVNKNIISRKPIFSADAVKDSVLFVGINPSFNPNDDKIFVHGECSETLMYGSFYQLSNAPEYFKKLELFAEKLNKPYTQINLLYARENDRELLLNSDSNFIREQLELTYETILKINPVVIIFFSDYCKNLIFGADRWINPDSNLNDRFILNGTNIPVFFTEDITFLSIEEQQALIQKINLYIVNN